MYFSAHLGSPLLNALATRDPDPARLARLGALRAVRALTTLPSPAGGAELWSARGADGAAGVFLAGAARAERLGQPAAARLWLAMERLSRGDPAGARALLKDAGASLPLPPNPRDPAAWENEPLGRALRQSLEAR